MGKKSRRRDRHRVEREADLAEQEADLRDGMVTFSTYDLTQRLGMDALPDLGIFVHPTALRRVLDWEKVVQTAADAGHPDPTRCGVISFKSNGKRIRLIFSDLALGHPAALLSSFEQEALQNQKLTHEELRAREGVF